MISSSTTFTATELPLPDKIAASTALPSMVQFSITVSVLDLHLRQGVVQERLRCRSTRWMKCSSTLRPSTFVNPDLQARVSMPLRDLAQTSSQDPCIICSETQIWLETKRKTFRFHLPASTKKQS